MTRPIVLSLLIVLCLMTAAEGLVASAAAQQSPASAAGSWVVPRTPDGQPDLQGNWSSATLTPLERPRDQGRVLTREEVQRIERAQADVVTERTLASDPNRAPPVAGGYEFTIDDPTTYTEPWGGEVPMKALHDRLYEYACHEGNYALSNILSGARHLERMEKEAAGSRD